MNPNVNVIILANRQSDNKHDIKAYPPFLAERNGVSVLQKILSSCAEIENAKFRFAVLNSDVEEYKLFNIVQQLSEKVDLCVTSHLTRGSACTALLATCDIEQSHELLVISANEIVEINLKEFISNSRIRNLDASTIVFQSIHPRYSYVKYNQEEYITEFAQKLPISNTATTGLFWFKKTSNFVDATKEMIKHRNPIDGNFYVGLALNEMILDGKKIGFKRISEKNYYPLKDSVQSTNYQIGKLDGEI
jgi:hypothetical protein